MSRRFSWSLVAAGTLLLLLAVGGSLYNGYEDRQAGLRAQALLAQAPIARPPFAQAPPDGAFPPSPPPDEARQTAPSAERTDGGAPETIGVLSIPALDLTLPVLDACTDAWLKLSVCRFSGSLDSADSAEPGRLVIAGHNYRSHFGNLPNLTEGDAVIVTAPDGRSRSYTVDMRADIGADDSTALEAGEWDLTLFTCNFARDRRILIRCIRDPE